MEPIANVGGAVAASLTSNPGRAATATLRLGVPRVPGGLVPRPEPSSRIGTSTLTVIRGPAGSGKSMLVAQWLAEAGVGDVLWVSRTADIDSRLAFWQAVLVDLARFGAGPRAAAELLHEDGVLPALRAARAALDRPLVLVLDNFGPPGDDWERVAADVVAAFDGAPGLRVVVAGREATGLEAVPGVVAVTGGELRVTAEDARRLADAQGLAHLGDADVARICDAVHGLVFPLRYAFEAMSRARREARPDDGWADQLANDMLARIQDPEFAEHAGAIAQAPYATAGLVAELLGMRLPQAEDVLRRMTRPGIGHRDAEGVFRFSERARTILGARYQATHPAEAAAGAVVVAQWLRERDRAGEAVGYALRGGDLDLATDLIVESLLDLVPQDLETILGLADRIEPERLGAHPALATALGTIGMARLRQRSARAEAFAQLVRTSREALEQERGMRRRFMVQTSLAIALWGLGRQADSLEAVRAALAAAEGLTGVERTGLGKTYPLLLGQLGRAAFDAGAGDLAAATFRAELEASPRALMPRRHNVALGDVAMLLTYAGRMREAEALLAAVDPDAWGVEPRDVAPTTSWRLATAYVALNRGDFDGAVAVLEEYEEPRGAAVDNWALVAVARAVALSLGGAARAAELA
ncbi:MAG: hypothetical protein J7480_10170, partial [Microbacteriaceae bacterium]|nr:hypothetical protein [Microbacteriaceae bacterium]